MTIELELKNNQYLFEAKNEDGVTFNLDAAPDMGGTNSAMRPMQAVASALGTCSSIDILNILRKQRKTISDFRVKVEATRKDNETPSVFDKINLHYIVKGSADEASVQKAIDLSLGKYCSVSKMLEKTAKITSSFEIIMQ